MSLHIIATSVGLGPPYSLLCNPPAFDHESISIIYIPTHRHTHTTRDYRLRVILCLVDAEDSAGPLLEINRMALMEECTLLLAWSTLEAARCVGGGVRLVWLCWGYWMGLPFCVCVPTPAP